MTRVGNSEIVRLTDDGYGNPAVEIKCDNGTTEVIDRRAVNTRDLTPGKRGHLSYRDYEFGSRLFFDAVLPCRVFGATACCGALSPRGRVFFSQK